MRIRHVEIKGYRGLVDVRFPVGEGATLVGKNNAGKSSILEARTQDYGQWLRRALAPLARSAGLRYLASAGIDTEALKEAINQARERLDTRITTCLARATGHTAPVEPTLSVGTRDIDLGTEWIERLFDAPPIDFPRQLGDGAQRRLLVQALKLYQDQELWPGGASLVLAIEEPELFLHPGAQRELADLIKQLRANRVQTLVSTHSAIMIDRASLEDVLLVQATTNEALGETQRTVLPLQGKEPFQAVLDVLGYRKSEVVQAACGVLVEGPSDRAILEAWASKLEHDFAALGIIVVPCEGHSNMPAYANVAVFSQFDYPRVAVLDGDLGNRRSQEIAERLRGMEWKMAKTCLSWKVDRLSPTST